MRQPLYTQTNGLFLPGLHLVMWLLSCVAGIFLQSPCLRPSAQGHSLMPWDTDAGEDLLVASADKPFRFPATFTFVVRSFTVLDGIGKSLDPRFDISEIAAPYARDLILEGRPQIAKLQQEFGKRLDKQVRSCLSAVRAGPTITTASEVSFAELRLSCEAQRELHATALIKFEPYRQAPQTV